MRHLWLIPLCWFASWSHRHHADHAWIETFGISHPDTQNWYDTSHSTGLIWGSGGLCPKMEATPKFQRFIFCQFLPMKLGPTLTKKQDTAAFCWLTDVGSCELPHFQATFWIGGLFFFAEHILQVGSTSKDRILTIESRKTHDRNSGKRTPITLYHQNTQNASVSYSGMMMMMMRMRMRMVRVRVRVRVRVVRVRRMMGMMLMMMMMRMMMMI